MHVPRCDESASGFPLSLNSLICCAIFVILRENEAVVQGIKLCESILSFSNVTPSN